MVAFSFFTTAEMKAAGHTAATLRDDCAAGPLFRVIKGWYGTTGTPMNAVLAMRMGGRIGCVSALELYGAWMPPDAALHVFFPTSASGRRSAGRPKGSEVVRHWHGRQARTGSGFAVPPLEVAIADALECQPAHLLIAILDSLLHRRIISRNRLETLIARGPVRHRHLARHLEPKSEEGIESIARYRLRTAGVATTVQVKMRSKDRLDLELDGWLDIELDGREWHAQQKSFTKDRRRVVRVMREGRLVLQFSYATLMYDFDFVLESILAVRAQYGPIGPVLTR